MIAEPSMLTKLMYLYLHIHIDAYAEAYIRICSVYNLRTVVGYACCANVLSHNMPPCTCTCACAVGAA